MDNYQEREDRYLEQVDFIEKDIAAITTEIEYTKQRMLESGATQILLHSLEELVILRCNQKIALQELHDDYQEECYYGY